MCKSGAVSDITNLKARITDPFATITEDMLENTWREIDYRLDVLRATKGTHVLLKKLLELSYIMKKIYVCIPRSFLVINVCKRGKTLCSPCITDKTQHSQQTEVHAPWRDAKPQSQQASGRRPTP